MRAAMTPEDVIEFSGLTLAEVEIKVCGLAQE